MNSTPDLETAAAHKKFSAECFNSAWDLIDQASRTPEENEQMIRLAHAAMWHWTQREDVTPKNLSIGNWQLSRIYALVGEVENARKYGRLCLDITPKDLPFFVGYAHEAIARAEQLAGNTDAAKTHLAEAHLCADVITDEGNRTALLNDLRSLEE